MNDSIDLVILKNFVECFFIEQIYLIKSKLLTGNFFHAVQRFLLAV